MKRIRLCVVAVWRRCSSRLLLGIEMETSSAKLFMVAAAALFFGGFIGYSYWYEAARHKKLHARGQEVQAVIWSLRQNTGKSGNGIPIVGVRFRHQNRTQTSECYVTEDTFKSLQQMDKIRILFLEDDPYQICLPEDGNAFTNRLWLACGSVPVSLLFILFGCRQRNSGH